jgi:hypothetical protein
VRDAWNDRVPSVAAGQQVHDGLRKASAYTHDSFFVSPRRIMIANFNSLRRIEKDVRKDMKMRK